MVAQKQPSLKRRRRSRGNAILEGVFTLLPTFALILAFVDFGLMLYRWSSLQNAVREGARYAITMQTASGLGHRASIKAVVARNSMGLVQASDTTHLFVKYYTQFAPDVEVPSGGNVPGNIVEVSVQNISFSWIAPLSGSYSGGIFYNSNTPLNLKAYAFDILGGLPPNVSSIPQ